MRVLLLTLLLLTSAASAADPPIFDLTLKDHRFTPAEIHVAKGQVVILRIHNEDATADEFDSTALQVEKIIPGNYTASVRLRPLGPGRYPFIGEFHPDTAQGAVIAE